MSKTIIKKQSHIMMASRKSSLNGRFLSATSTTATGLLMLMGDFCQVQTNPLVYPNRFSFQKTTPSITTSLPKYDQDHSNHSISTFGNAIANAESGLPSSYSRGFRYDIAAWVIGAILLVCIIWFLLYPKKKRAGLCNMFQKLDDKADIDSSRVFVSPNNT